MIIGDRLRALREDKKLSQGEIEKRTGLLRCYISRVENGHTVPAIETMEKMARPWKFPCMSFSMKERNRLSCRVFPIANRLTTSPGAVLVKILLASTVICAGSSAITPLPPFALTNRRYGSCSLMLQGTIDTLLTP